MILSLGNVTSAPSPAQNSGENQGMSTFKKLLLFAGGAVTATAALALKRKADLKSLKTIGEELKNGIKTTKEKISKDIGENTVKKVKKTTKKKSPPNIFTQKHIKEILESNEKDIAAFIKKINQEGNNIILKGYTPNQLILTHEKPVHSFLTKMKSGIEDITLFKKYDIDAGTLKEVLKINKINPSARTV